MDGTWWHTIMVIAVLVFVIWSFIIYLIATANNKTET